MLDFISGASTMGFFVAALFFLRFWRNTAEPLFASFAAAFFLFGMAHGLLTLAGIPIEERSWIYLIRLAAFLIILAGIARKNLSH
nr:DUF5985 family protein [Sphingomonas sp. R-74633]